jgi:hypothetical protein
MERISMDFASLGPELEDATSMSRFAVLWPIRRPCTTTAHDRIHLVQLQDGGHEMSVAP